MKLPESQLTKRQTINFHKHVTLKECGTRASVTVNVRHDDECGNGHNTFSITVDVYESGKPRTDANMIMCGCCHDIVRDHFPDLYHLVKWHLTSTDGPLHYVANTLYHASDRDCHGRRKGEPCSPETRIKFDGFPITFKKSQKFLKWLQGLENYDLEVMPVHHRDRGKPGEYQFGPKYTFLPYSADKWHYCPFDTESDALEFLEALQEHTPKFVTVFTSVGEGKEPNLDAARSAACWPDATLEQLQDKNALLERLPALLESFKADVESLGLVY